MFLSDGFLYRENIFQMAWRNVNLYRLKIMSSFFNCNKQELRQLFCLWYMQFYEFMKIVRYVHSLVIYSSVTSGHPDKYSYEIPHVYLLA